MRRKGIWTSVLAMAMFAGSVSATPITNDGNWSDWFSYGGNTAFNTWNEGLVTTTNLNIRTQNDEEGTSPGGGGQLYDIEQIFYYYDDADNNNLTGGTLHIGLVTGFPSGGVPSDGYYAGDLFLDFGNTGSDTHAIAVGTENTAANNFGARFGQAWGNSGAPSWSIVNPSPFVSSAPYRVNENLPGAVAIGGVQVAWGSVGVHNFLEVTIAVDGASEDVLTNANGGLGLHWTEGCGNDVIDVSDDTPFVPVPEPATMALLGMGVLGIALRSRKPTC